jgi:hypothetical protein
LHSSFKIEEISSPTIGGPPTSLEIPGFVVGEQKNLHYTTIYKFIPSFPFFRHGGK